jgi:hypothetical protein
MSAQPDFMQASPTVYGFDFNALAGVSGGVPDSDSAPVVKHDDVVRTGNNAVPSSMGGLEVVSQPAQPPHGHGNTIPGYPWEGHPEIAYSQPFMGPGGTSPMRRGGPNVGAYAVAPAMPTAYQGAAYPYATPGTYTPNEGQAPFGGYGAVDLDGINERIAAWRAGAPARQEKRQAARQARKNAPIDVQGSGGYVYRLFPDGQIKIMASPKGGVGNMVSPGMPEHAAITAEVGTWQQNRATARLTGLTAAAQGITAITQAATGGGRRRGGRRGGRRQAAPPAYTAPQESGGLPGWVLPVVGGGIGLVVLWAAFAPRDKPKRRRTF